MEEKYDIIFFYRFTNNTKDVNMFIKVVIPRFEITGDYTINGKVLILPIVGQGKSNISAGEEIIDLFILNVLL